MSERYQKVGRIMKKLKTKRIVELWKAKDLISAFESGRLDLSTDYQRYEIWPEHKRGLLIDSMLSDIDIPKIYLAYFTSGDKYECIDGKQRIVSIVEFYNGNLPTISKEYFKDLQDQSLFLDYDFSMSIIRNPTANDILELFYRLNIGEPLNGGELIHAMAGNMRDFIFKTIRDKGPFIGTVGMKAYRFSRESTIAQMIINSLYFRETAGFTRARYEDIYEFFKKAENVSFSSAVRTKANKFYSTLKKVGDVFGKNASKLNRKSAIVSAYLFCEEIIEKKAGKNLKEFPLFYLKLLDEMSTQGGYIKNYKEPTNATLLANFQRYLQQASAEDYSIERRHNFLGKAFSHYLRSGKILDKYEYKD